MIACCQQVAQAASEAGVDETGRDHPDEGREHIHRKPQTNRAGCQVDQPERKNRDEPQHQQITQRVFAEAGFEPADARTGALDEPGDAGPNGEKNDGGADRRAEHGVNGAEPAPKKEAAGDRQERRRRQ